MELKSFKYLLVALIIVSISLNTQIFADIEEENWMDPDSWSTDHLIFDQLHTKSSDLRKCSENIQGEHPNPNGPQNVDDAAALLYFKKFIAILFNRKNFKYDSTQQLYERSIVIAVHTSQMDKLEQLQDPRDLDYILTEIINNANTPNMYRDGQQHVKSNEFYTLVLNLLYDVYQLTKTSEIRFLLVVIIVILIAWIFKNRFNIGWLPLICGGMFIFGYLYTYLECNRELEVNEMLEILNFQKKSESGANGYNFVNFFKEIFSNTDEQSIQKQKIKQSAKISLGFCRPDHVLIMYLNDIFLKYLQVLLEQCTVALTTLNTSLGFPYNMFSGFFLIYLICFVTKLSFKYVISPSAWVPFMYRKQLYQSEKKSIGSENNSQDDRLSGDNLKLLLNAINTPAQRVVIHPDQKLTAIAVSGVEEVKEPVKSNPREVLPLLDSAPKAANNNFNDKTMNEKADVSIEDLCNDS